MARFDPEIVVLQPSAQSTADHLGTVRIDTGELKVHLLFHKGDALRLRVHKTSMVIDECYLKAGKNKFVVIGVKPGV